MSTLRTSMLAAACLVTPTCFAQWAVDSSVIACGGGVSSGGTFSIRATIGACDAAPQLGSLTFTVNPGFQPAASVRANPCPGDHNTDGTVDGDDVIAFFSDWDRGELVADKNRDSGVDGDDVIVFFSRWDGGC